MNELNYKRHEIVLLVSLIFFTLVYMIWGVSALDHNRVVMDEPTPEVSVTAEVEEPEPDIFEPVVTEVVEPEPEPEIEEPEPEPVVYPQLWTEPDAIALAKMLYGEARGVAALDIWDGRTVSGDAQKAACVWTVLNRYDAGFEESIYEVVTAYDQYHGYKRSHPIDEDLLELVYDVLDRWNREKHGETDVGRVIPADYYWFKGDGEHNWFMNEYRSRKYWSWSLEDVYGDQDGV